MQGNQARTPSQRLHDRSNATVNRALRILLLLAFLAGLAPCAVAQDQPQPIPALGARVTDLTGTLDASQKQTLESELEALEKAKGTQVGVLMVPSTAPEDIASYGIRVGDAWKLGRQASDDGVILIVAKNDRRVRIEVGQGLEGAIPDAAAARIIREYIAPRFRANDYYGGIHDATGALTKLINDEPLPPPLTDDQGGGQGDTLMPALIAAWFVALFLRGLFGRSPGVARAGIVGVGAGAVAWLISGLVLVGVGAGVLGLFFGLLGGGGGGGGFANRGGYGGFGGGGWSGGSGGGFGGGGFSGGGGGFSGGGASGSW